MRVDGVVLAREEVALNLVEDVGGGAARINRDAAHIYLNALNKGVGRRKTRSNRGASSDRRSSEDHTDIVHLQERIRR